MATQPTLAQLMLAQQRRGQGAPPADTMPMGENYPQMPPEAGAPGVGVPQPPQAQPAPQPTLKNRVLGGLTGQPGGGIGGMVGRGLMGAAQSVVNPSRTFNGREWGYTPQVQAQARLGEEMPLEQQRLGGQALIEKMRLEEEDKRLQEMLAATSMRGQYGLQGREITGQYGLAGREATGEYELQREGMRDESQANLQGQRLGQQWREFQNTDQYRRWKTAFDNDTKLKVAQMVQSRAPAQTLQTGIFAQGGLNQLGDAQKAMSELEQSGVMGQSWAQNKIEDWIFGAGVVDPSLPPQTRQAIGRLRAALTYTSSAAMRAHTGRTSQQIYEDFKNTLGPGQDWNALRGAIEETTNMLSFYASAASNANIQNMRQGQPAAPPPAAGGGGAAGPWSKYAQPTP